MVGGPEDLLDLADLGVVGRAPVQLAVDADQSVAPARVVLTDGLRAVERNFGRLHDSVSPTLSSEEWRDLSRSGVPDYSLEDGARWLTVADLEGAESVTASSTQADPDALGFTRRGALPEAAVDGDPDRWRSAAFAATPSGGARPRLAARSRRGHRRVGNAGDEVLVVSLPTGSQRTAAVRAGESRSVEVPGDHVVHAVSDVSRAAGQRARAAEVEVGIDVRSPPRVCP